MKLLLNFLPMVLLYLLVAYTPEVARFSHTILGKLCAIALIVFYTVIDKFAGLAVCAIVIFYYQTDYVERFSPFLKEGFEQEEKEDEDKEDTGSEGFEDDNEDKEDKEDNEDTKFEGFDQRELIALDAAYPLGPTAKISYDKNIEQFRQTHCSKGHLMHKGQIVKPEMSEHIYPEITQDSFHKCNICDPTCNFDFNVVSIEHDIIKPKSSHE
jgi:hypothetical protein